MKREKHNSVLRDARREFHKKICEKILGYKDGKGNRYLSCADRGSPASIGISDLLVKQIDFPLCNKLPTGQTSGSEFAEVVCDFVRSLFLYLHDFRPGNWSFRTKETAIDNFEQYQHLSDVERVLKRSKELRAFMGSDYVITPDIVVSRSPISEAEFNQQGTLTAKTAEIAAYTGLREINRNPRVELLHASISCKWTLRSDRAQNIRTEALNLLRNRKGSNPQICAVTMEPLPSRLAAIAMGTGDIDMTYHAALPELIYAVKEFKNKAETKKENSDREAQLQTLTDLVDGKRLRDISDLPFDLIQ